MNTRNQKDLVFSLSAANPYWTDRFQALHDASDVDFEVWFGRDVDPARSWVVNEEEFTFPHEFLGIEGLSIPSIYRLSKKILLERPARLVTFHAVPTLAPSFLTHLLRDSRLYYYVERTYETWVSRSTKKEYLKKLLIGNADGVLAPGPDGAEYARRYGAKKVFSLPHVIDVDHFRTASSSRDSEEVVAARDSLGLSGTVFLYVGRIWRQKGIATLLEAFEWAARSNECSLLFVGDGSDKELVDDFRDRNPDLRIVMLDFVQQSALPAVYALGDVFVFPTRGDPYGLVVNEAMAAGLPVVASDHAGEIRERVVDGVNGFIVPVDDSVELSHALAVLATDDAMQRSMRLESLRRSESFRVGEWVKAVEKFVRDTERV